MKLLLVFENKNKIIVDFNMPSMSDLGSLVPKMFKTTLKDKISDAKTSVDETLLSAFFCPELFEMRETYCKCIFLFRKSKLISNMHIKYQNHSGLFFLSVTETDWYLFIKLI